MGLDVGFDIGGNLFLFEVKSFPITKPSQTEIAFLRAGYYTYLAKTKFN